MNPMFRFCETDGLLRGIKGEADGAFDPANRLQLFLRLQADEACLRALGIG